MAYAGWQQCRGHLSHTKEFTVLSLTSKQQSKCVHQITFRPDAPSLCFKIELATSFDLSVQYIHIRLVPCIFKKIVVNEEIENSSLYSRKRSVLSQSRGAGTSNILLQSKVISKDYFGLDSGTWPHLECKHWSWKRLMVLNTMMRILGLLSMTSNGQASSAQSRGPPTIMRVGKCDCRVHSTQYLTWSTLSTLDNHQKHKDVIIMKECK